MALQRRKNIPYPHIEEQYAKITALDGSHPLKTKVPYSYVEYPVKYRKNGKVVFFNFELAKKLGLIPEDHTNKLTRRLSKTLLETFSNVIVNEYDMQHGAKLDTKAIKSNRFMATRYLQLQHPGRQGLTSGDGRSIWNGVIEHNGQVWDVSSRGTGATCLSPASAQNKKFFQTGDPTISYGCGYAWLSEGIVDVIFSEIFERNNVATERILCVIEFENQYSITVRAAPNLIRPSHFFTHLKQNQYHRLKNMADYFIERQIQNKVWKPVPKNINKYKYMLQQLNETFAKMVAKFESEYIFCWLAWDGDNILADGGIIDFGSIRQFGLFHHEYKFDDSDRWSTNIKQQKNQARYTIQVFAQIVDFINTQKKKDIASFRKSSILKEFDKIFIQTKRELLLQKLGFQKDQVDILVKKYGSTITAFEKVYYNFESAKSKRGPYRVPDGITWNAIFSMRDILRELPAHFIKNQDFLSDQKFMNIIKSSYAGKRDTRLSLYRRYQIKQFQKTYVSLVNAVAKSHKLSFEEVLLGVIRNSSIINRADRITGDSVTIVSEKILAKRKHLTSDQFHTLLTNFIKNQIRNPDYSDEILHNPLGNNKQGNLIMKRVLRIVKDYSEGL